VSSGATADADAADGIALMREFIKHSPFAQEIGLELGEIGPDAADVHLPFRAALATFGSVLHGGAIATAADVAAMAAAFAGAEFSGIPKGATVGFSLNYLTAVRGVDVTARARVVKRGKSLNFIDVEVLTDASEVAARGHVIYKIT